MSGRSGLATERHLDSNYDTALYCFILHWNKVIRTILSTIKDWDLLHQRHLELFLQGYCALQESQIKMNFNLAVAPPLAYQ